MPNLIDIRRRIRSVKNTQQITKAMKMVAASKLRRSQERVLAARPYARTLEAMLAHVAARIRPGEDGALPHPLLAQREEGKERRVVVVTVTADKGLCGAFNANVNRATGAFLRDAKAAKALGHEEVSLFVLGRKGVDFWKRRSIPIVDRRPGIFTGFGYETAAEIVRSLAQKYVAGEIDAVYVVYNEFKNVISQVVRTKRLLPLEIPAAGATGAAGAAGGVKEGQGEVDYIFEPAPDVILARLVPRHLEFQLFQVLLESAAAENASRMTAMEGASKNAGELIGKLSLIYNRARQAKITKELIEIVSGAAALG